MQLGFGDLFSIGILAALMAVGLSLLFFLSPVPDQMLTTAQRDLIEIGDTMVKGSLGGFLGYAGGRVPRGSGYSAGGQA